MGRPISMDLRERVVAAVRSGMSRRQAAARFEVAPSTVVDWVRRADAQGHPFIGKIGGHRKFSLAAELPWIRARLMEKPDISLRELLAELNGRGLVVSYFAVWNIVHRGGLSFKKKPARQRARPA
jgi:transposase